MRFTLEYKPKPKETHKIGDTIRKKYFAIFPVKIGKEFRWLEMVYVEKKLTCTLGIVDGFGFTENDKEFRLKHAEWKNISFIDTPHKDE